MEAAAWSESAAHGGGDAESEALAREMQRQFEQEEAQVLLGHCAEVSVSVANPSLTESCRSELPSDPRCGARAGSGELTAVLFGTRPLLVTNRTPRMQEKWEKQTIRCEVQQVRLSLGRPM